MKPSAYLFPGQASQFVGMGKELYEESKEAKQLFEQANDILGYRISDVMFHGNEEDLQQTEITQPSVFIYSYIKYYLNKSDEIPAAVAGHSLGELTAMVAAGALSFEAGLVLVKERAESMQMACERQASTMAAIVGLEDEVIEDICSSINGIVVPVNYNCPGQLVIAGELDPIDEAIEKLTQAGAKRAIKLNVGGAFHSPLMKPAEERLSAAIERTEFITPLCPIYQNVSAMPVQTPVELKNNLAIQLTSAVRWSQTMSQMHADGVEHFIEYGSRVLAGFLKRIDRTWSVESHP